MLLGVNVNQVINRENFNSFQVTGRLALQCTAVACVIVIFVAQIFKSKNQDSIGDKYAVHQRDPRAELKCQIKQLEQRVINCSIVSIVSAISCAIFCAFLTSDPVQLCFIAMAASIFILHESCYIHRAQSEL